MCVQISTDRRREVRRRRRKAFVRLARRSRTSAITAPPAYFHHAFGLCARFEGSGLKV